MSKTNKSQATSAETPTALKHVLDKTGISAITTAVVSGAADIAGSGNLITRVCVVAARYAKSKPLTAEDIDDVMRGVIPKLKAKSRQTRDNVASTWRKVLATYQHLPEAEQLLRLEAGVCAWHDVSAMASMIKAGKTVTQAVRARAAFLKGRRNGEPSQPKNPKGSAARAVKSILSWHGLPREFKAGLRQLCAEHGIKL